MSNTIQWITSKSGKIKLEQVNKILSCMAPVRNVTFWFSENEKDMTDKEIHDRDVNWLQQADGECV